MAYLNWVKWLAIIEARKQNKKVETATDKTQHVYAKFIWDLSSQGYDAREKAYNNNDYSWLISHLSHENLETIYLLFEWKELPTGASIMYKWKIYKYIHGGEGWITLYDESHSNIDIDIDDLIVDSGKKPIDITIPRKAPFFSTAEASIKGLSGCGDVNHYTIMGDGSVIRYDKYPRWLHTTIPPEILETYHRKTKEFLSDINWYTKEDTTSDNSSTKERVKKNNPLYNLFN